MTAPFVPEYFRSQRSAQSKAFIIFTPSFLFLNLAEASSQLLKLSNSEAAPSSPRCSCELPCRRRAVQRRYQLGELRCVPKGIGVLQVPSLIRFVFPAKNARKRSGFPSSTCRDPILLRIGLAVCNGWPAQLGPWNTVGPPRNLRTEVACSVIQKSCNEFNDFR